jgi:glycosyltransferase involved in cell wall biosynthesis
MHVLIYCDDPGAGGTAENAAVLAEGLSRLGFAVSVAAHGSWTSALSGATAYPLDYNPSRLSAKAAWSRNEPEGVLLRAKPDLVLFCDCAVDSSLAAKAVCRDWNIPHIIHTNYVCPACLARLGRLFAPVGEALHAAAAVVAVTTENLLLLRQAFGLSEAQSAVIHNGRPRRWFEPAPPGRRDAVRAAWDIGPEDVVCLTVARYEPRKGYRHLLEAGAELIRRGLPRGRPLFVWIGHHQGDAAGELMAQVDARGLSRQVLVLGQRSDIDDWLAAADLFVLLSEAEGMPLSIMEAMAKGVPVVASAISGIPEELGDAGILTPDPGKDPHGAAAALVEAVTWLAGDPDARLALGQRGRQRALDLFQADRMVEAFARLARRHAPDHQAAWPDARTYRPPHTLPLGQSLALGDDAVALEVLKEGWSHGEGQGRWTDGEQARLVLALPGDGREGLVLTLCLKPFLRHPGSLLELRLALDGREIGLVRWDAPQGETRPASFAVFPDRPLRDEATLTLSLQGVSSPASLGLSDDARRLGVWVSFVRLDRLRSA